MTQTYLGLSYGMNSPSTSSFQHAHKLEDYESGTDVEDAESIYSIRTPARNMTLPDSSETQIPSIEKPKNNVAETKNRDGFRPKLDVPKIRASNIRFNRIRQVKDEESTTKAESSEVLEVVHTQPVSRMPTSPSSGSIPPLRPKRACSVQSFKVEKGSDKTRRTVHNRKLGPSMTENTMDYRERKKIEKQYRDHLAELLDTDIVREVEEEGGITPPGRLYKASVRMLERVKEERGARSIIVSDVKMEGDAVSARELETMRQRVIKAEGATQRLKSALEALLRSSDD